MIRPLRYFAKIFILSIPVIITALSDCRNPNDFRPSEDTLIYPPPKPELLIPENNYTFITDTNEVYFFLSWTPVESAQAYILELTIVGNSESLIMEDTTYLGLIDKYHFGVNTWRVKASSGRWKGNYTEWSEKRIFYTATD
jgi:hypothetical protein